MNFLFSHAAYHGLGSASAMPTLTVEAALCMCVLNVVLCVPCFLYLGASYVTQACQFQRFAFLLQFVVARQPVVVSGVLLPEIIAVRCSLTRPSSTRRSGKGKVKIEDQGSGRVC